MLGDPLQVRELLDEKERARFSCRESSVPALGRAPRPPSGDVPLAVENHRSGGG